MKDKEKDLTTTIGIIIAVISLVAYYLLAMNVWRLAQYGGINRYLKLLIYLFVIFFVSFMISLIIIFRNRKRGIKYPALFKRILIAAFVLTTVFWSFKIYRSAQPFNGALSWKIHEWKNKRTYDFTHNNIINDGIFGFLKDIEVEDEIEDNLYLSDNLKVRAGKKGEIIFLEGFIYGANKKGETKSFLVYYDASKDEKVNVMLNGCVDERYEREKLLKPAVDISLSKEFKYYLSILTNKDQDIKYEIEYSGMRDFQDPGTVFPSGSIVVLDEKIKNYDKDDAKENMGGMLKAYALEVKTSDRPDFSKYFLSQTEYIDSKKMSEDKASEDLKKAYEEDAWSITEDGSVLFVSKNNEKNIWKLSIADAALGSYFYKLDFSNDSGGNWQDINSNPFNNELGQAQGMIFLDEKLGFIAIDGKSGEHSSLYRTEDAGKNFKKIEVNMAKIEKLPEIFKENNLKLEDLKYITLPVMKEGRLELLVKASSMETDALKFVSKDNGISWEFAEEE